MRKHTYLLLLAILPQLFSCGGDTSELDSLKDELENLEEEVSIEDAKTMTLDEAKAITWEERKPVTIEGYFQLPHFASIKSSGQSCDFFGRRNQITGNSLSVYVPVGSGNNQMAELKSGFLAKDFKAKDNGGVTIGVNQRVKVTGLLYSYKSLSEGEPNMVYFDAKKIEKVDEKDADYEALGFPTLTKEIADNKSEHDHEEYMVEGRLEVPMLVLTGDEMTIELIDNAGNKFNIDVVTGTGANQMESLDSGWTQKDVKIRDYQGNLVPVGKKVRVYGVLALDGLHVEYIKVL